MHKVTVNTGNTVWAFLFKEKEPAEIATGAVRAAISANKTDTFGNLAEAVSIEDDFGQNALMAVASIHGVMIEDMDLTQEAMIKLHLHNSHTQIKAQQRVQSDATIKAAQIGNGGGMVFDPMAGRRFS